MCASYLDFTCGGIFERVLAAGACLFGVAVKLNGDFGIKHLQCEAVFEFGIGESVPLSEQDGFEHGQQGIGGTVAVVSEITGSLTVQVLFDRLPINHLIQLLI